MSARDPPNLSASTMAWNAPLISKYAARRKNRVAAACRRREYRGYGVVTVYPAKSWVPHGRAHELQIYGSSRNSKGVTLSESDL